MKKKKAHSLPVAVIGSGPAGLMAADVISQAGYLVKIFEKKKGPGKKFLIAGSSGLNITYQAPLETFHTYYRNHQPNIKEAIQKFTPDDWIKFVENLGIKTFLGTSRRYFVEGLKASPMLRVWLKKLKEREVTLHNNHEVCDFESTKNGIQLKFTNAHEENFVAVCFCLGGGSYEPKNKPPLWPALFSAKKLNVDPFLPSNVGYNIAWPKEFVKEAEGLPLKNINFTSPLGSQRGDLVVTSYGLEGTPVYSLAQVGEIYLDLKPDLSAEQILKKVSASKENHSPLRLIKKYLNLSEASLALLYHLTPPLFQKDLRSFIAYLKHFPIILKSPRPLKEAISSAGGLDMNELSKNLMLKKFPGIFVAGEMLDWDAPTGGFLIQACVSQGFVAGQGICDWLNKKQH